MYDELWQVIAQLSPVLKRITGNEPTGEVFAWRVRPQETGFGRWRACVAVVVAVSIGGAVVGERWCFVAVRMIRATEKARRSSDPLGSRAA